MGILTGRDEALKLIVHFDLAFIGPLTDYKKGLNIKGIHINLVTSICMYRYVNTIFTTNRSLYA